jgi:hypothetical protein
MNTDHAARDHNHAMLGGRIGLGGALRVAFVLFGGMFALQSSQDLDSSKVVYLVGGVVCLVAALGAVWRRRDSAPVRRARIWLACSCALITLLALSFVVARTNGTPIMDWLRDVASYALFAAVPVFALDAEGSTPRRIIIIALVAIGLLGGISWAIEWLDRRHIVELSIARLLFPSAYLPATLYVFAVAAGLVDARRRPVWLLIAGVTLALFLVTGTRSSLLLLSAPIGMVVFLGWTHLRSSVIAVVSHAAVAAALVLTFQLALVIPDSAPPAVDPVASEAGATPAPGVVTDRFGSIPSLVGSPGSDPSMRERVAQYRAAWELFASSPIIGVGPGHAIEWTNVSGQLESGFVADTPLVMPAKFGLVGVALFAAFGLAYWKSVRSVLYSDRRSPITLAFIGYGVWTIVTLPLGFLVEDKGASLGLILLVALAYGQRAKASALRFSSPSGPSAA